VRSKANPLKIVAISGSLRENSLNTSLLRSLQCLAPDSLDVEVVTLGDIAMYDEDLEGDNAPLAVESLRETVTQADGLILSTPEYNRSMSGAMKNALDWLSRPAHDGALKGKNCVALVATESTYHGMGAWVELARMLRHMNNHVVEPDLVVHSAHTALGITPDGGVGLLDSWPADALRVQLTSLQEAINADLGGQLLRSYDVFANRLYRPRRAAMEYPLKLREVSAGELESKRNAW
jgi:chromate reductase